MGNYLPNPQQSFVSATTQELQEALTIMGPLFQVYIPLISQHGILGASFEKALKRPALFRDLFDQVGIVNPLHRIVLESRVRSHHAKNIVMATCSTTASPSTTEDCGDSDSPQDLVHVLPSMETDKEKDDDEQSNNFAMLYSKAVLEHCLSIDILAKLRKLDQWNVVFEALGVINLMHQNVLYNRVLDVANERKRKQQQNVTMTTTTTAKLAGKESETTKAGNTPIYKATRKGTMKRQKQKQHIVNPTTTTLEEKANETEKNDVEPIYEATRKEAMKPHASVSSSDSGRVDNVTKTVEEEAGESVEDVDPIYDATGKGTEKLQTSVSGGGGLGRGNAQMMRGTQRSRAYISFKGDSEGRC